MKLFKVKYEIQENFVPLKITNLNKLVLEKLDFLEKSSINLPLDYINTEIISKEKLNCTWKDIFKIKIDHKLDFVPGDSIGLLCPNNINLVNGILEILNLSGNEIYRIKQIGRQGFEFEGTIRDFFKFYFDFTSLPKKAFLIDISNSSRDISNSTRDITNSSRDITNSSRDITNSSRDISNSSRDISNSSRDISNSSRDITNSSRDISNSSRDIEYLCSKEGTKDYLNMIKNWNNVLDILHTFGCKPNLSDLLMNCQLVKPRYYSLTNSINEKCEIILSTVEKDGRYGHVSDFIHNQESNKLKICHRQSRLFRAVPSKKILCVCTGTGAAPFLGFLKNKDDNQLVKIIYGFRNVEDDLLRDKYSNTDIIKVLSSTKMYVTDYIIQNLPEIGDFINEDCLVYVCGRPDMQKNVYKIFIENFKEFVDDKKLFFDSWI